MREPINVIFDRFVKELCKHDWKVMAVFVCCLLSFLFSRMLIVDYYIPKGNVHKSFFLINSMDFVGFFFLGEA